MQGVLPCYLLLMPFFRFSLFFVTATSFTAPALAPSHCWRLAGHRCRHRREEGDAPRPPSPHFSIFSVALFPHDYAVRCARTLFLYLRVCFSK